MTGGEAAEGSVLGAPGRTTRGGIGDGLEWLAEIKRRAKGATPGLWEALHHADGHPQKGRLRGAGKEAA